METLLFGLLGTLAASVVVTIGALAFRDSKADFRLIKVLMFVLGTCFGGYIAYAVGSIEGGKSAIGQIESGVAASDVKTEMPWWPLGVLGIIFSILVALTWFSDYLGIKGKVDEKT